MTVENLDSMDTKLNELFKLEELIGEAILKQTNTEAVEVEIKGFLEHSGKIVNIKLEWFEDEEPATYLTIEHFEGNTAIKEITNTETQAITTKTLNTIIDIIVNELGGF